MCNSSSIKLIKEVINKYPYKVKFTEINSIETRVSLSSNILKCLENEPLKYQNSVVVDMVKLSLEEV